MRKLICLIFSSLFILTFVSCKKDKIETKLENAYSFDGKDYNIFKADLSEIIFDEGNRIFIFLLSGKNAADTTEVILTLFDQNSNNLGGKYPAIGMDNHSATRGIVPYAILFGSGIQFNDVAETVYFTDRNGNVEISGSGTDYEIKINNLSAGTYKDINDEYPVDDNYGYSEVGLITGHYKGKVTRTIIKK